jgi:hypothetical protein
MTASPSSSIAVVSSDSEFEALLPPAHNTLGILVAVFLGAPWLVGFTVVGIALLVRVESGLVWRALLGLFLVFVITIPLTVLALLSIWYAFYTRRGQEMLAVDLEQVEVTHRALGIGIPFRAPRGFADRVVLIDEQLPGSMPRHRLEVHAGSIRSRIGAGIGEADAVELQRRAQEFLDDTRDRALELRGEDQEDERAEKAADDEGE